MLQNFFRLSTALCCCVTLDPMVKLKETNSLLACKMAGVFFCLSEQESCKAAKRSGEATGGLELDKCIFL